MNIAFWRLVIAVASSTWTALAKPKTAATNLLP